MAPHSSGGIKGGETDCSPIAHAAVRHCCLHHASKKYQENSSGRFTYRKAQENSGIANDGVVTAQLPITCPVYDSLNRCLTRGIYHGMDGKEYAIFDTPTLYAYAVAAVEDQVDFATYDTSGDGRIAPTELAIMLVLPGLNASVDWSSQANGQPGAWPHSSVIYSDWPNDSGETEYDLFRVQVDSVEVYKNTMTVENAGSPATSVDFDQVYDYYNRTSTALMTPIGTACRAMGHDLGLTDRYYSILKLLSALCRKRIPVQQR